MSLVDVLTEDELWIGEMRSLEVGSRRVLLLRTERGVRAYEDRCPHLGVPLSRGTLTLGTLTCGAHHYQFDADSGRGKNPTGIQLRSIGVVCQKGKILIDVDVAVVR